MTSLSADQVKQARLLLGLSAREICEALAIVRARYQEAESPFSTRNVSPRLMSRLIDFFQKRGIRFEPNGEVVLTDDLQTFNCEEKLKEIRERFEGCKFSQSSLADHAGISRRSLSELLNGERPLSEAEYKKLTQAINTWRF